MRVIRHIDEMRSQVHDWKEEGHKVALVPTMGFFHQGHLALMDRAAELAPRVVVSLFVNPTQFGPNEDLDQYPRDLNRDLELAERHGVHCVFAPEASGIYHPNHQTWVEVTGVSQGLCGASRPGHFRGVATVVAKLFNIVQPDVAIFGEKDFQQLQVIRTMARDLNFPVEICSHPIVREEDGLAMSSRNSYLSEDERASAVCLIRSLERARELISHGETSRTRVIDEITSLIDSYPHTRIDYIFIGDPETLAETEEIRSPVLVALAVFVGRTRLIDNSIL